MFQPRRRRLLRLKHRRQLDVLRTRKRLEDRDVATIAQRETNAVDAYWSIARVHDGHLNDVVRPHPLPRATDWDPGRDEELQIRRLDAFRQLLGRAGESRVDGELDASGAELHSPKLVPEEPERDEGQASRPEPPIDRTIAGELQHRGRENDDARR